MKKFIKNLSFIGLIASTPLLTGCYGERVEVPPGHIGKVLSKNGLEKDYHAPSQFRLPYDYWFNVQLILCETSDQAVEETFDEMIPKDNLKMSFDIRMTLNISRDDNEKLNVIFNNVPTSKNRGTTKIIDFDDIYSRYAQPIVRTKVREVIAKYTINHVMVNREAVSAEIQTAIEQELARTDSNIKVLNFGIARVSPPEVIIRAQEAAKEREIAIQKAEADKLVRLTEAQAALEVAKKQQEIDLTEAETQARVNEILNSNVNEAFVTQRMIKVWELLAGNPNKVFIFPDSMLHNPASLMGISYNMTTEAMNAAKK